MLMMYYKRHIISSPGAFFKSSSENRNLLDGGDATLQLEIEYVIKIFKSYQGVRHNESQPSKVFRTCRKSRIYLIQKAWLFFWGNMWSWILFRHQCILFCISKMCHITFELSTPSTFCSAIIQEGIVFKCNTEVGRDVSLGTELSSGPFFVQQKSEGVWITKKHMASSHLQ